MYQHDSRTSCVLSLLSQVKPGRDADAQADCGVPSIVAELADDSDFAAPTRQLTSGSSSTLRTLRALRPSLKCPRAASHSMLSTTPVVRWDIPKATTEDRE